MTQHVHSPGEHLDPRDPTRRLLQVREEVVPTGGPADVVPRFWEILFVIGNDEPVFPYEVGVVPVETFAHEAGDVAALDEHPR